MENENSNLNSKEYILSKIKDKYNHLSFWKRLFSWRASIDDITSLIEQIEIKSEAEIENKYLINEKALKEIHDEEIKLLKAENDALKDVERQMISDNKDLLREFEVKETNLNNDKDELVLSKGKLQNQIDQHTEIMMHKTTALLNIFERKSGSQGKISELALENIFEQTFAATPELWTTDLIIGSSHDFVEFAIKDHKESTKWIPVDSKSIKPDEGKNEQGESIWIIDDKYLKKIETEVKKITKYINKSNTSNFGILVLPTDEVFMFLSDQYKKELFEFGTKYKIIVTSPSNFIQYTLMISTLDNLASTLKNSEKYKEEITKVVTHIKNFYRATEDSVKKINIAFDKHLKNIDQNIERIEKIEQKNTYLIEDKKED